VRYEATGGGILARTSIYISIVYMEEYSVKTLYASNGEIQV
jgi:hypothetical protein